MAGKVWQPKDAKKFARQAKLNRPYYVVMQIATNLAPYEDSQLYSEYVFEGHRPFTGTPYCGSMDAESLCLLYGPVYEEPPADIRNIATPGPQVAPPLGSNDYAAYLDEAEIRGLEKRVANGSDPKRRRPLGGWRA
ncbi:hypothetical protein [Streptomyces sp. NPDC001410]|uniref:hypothetical protein n=1 Tax=Streptomyces sp. NPDC001410 TaxID=3364574 RepID=UPI0036A5A7C3